MIFMRILPGVLKELLKHVPTVLFEAVEWKLLASELPKLSRRIIQKEGFIELFDLQSAFLSPFKVKLVGQVDKQFNLLDQKQAAEKILTLYFAQIFSPHGLFLDLSPAHFEQKNDELNFLPSGVWTKFSPDFSEGLKYIYDGFYFEDENILHQGLIKSGLTSPKWPEADRQKLAELFKSNFGASITGEMSFDLESFKESFLKIADFMLIKKVHISTDFLYLGIALVTMYSSLEKTRAKVNVKEVYTNVKNQLESK
jgi:predicted unusual protein kinase regulating ubiquinone biosynthesis (AarF/ABC1/UbiB family)